MYKADDYQTLIWWSQEDGVYVAKCVELPGMMAHGDTRAAAAASIQEALEGLIKWKHELGEALPPPARLLAVA